MAKPIRRFYVLDCCGGTYTDCTRLEEARSHVREADKAWPKDAPHRIYPLVTLQERAVIRAAMRYVDGLGTDSVTLLLRKNTPLERLVKAVEAARGK